MSSIINNEKEEIGLAVSRELEEFQKFANDTKREFQGASEDVQIELDELKRSFGTIKKLREFRMLHACLNAKGKTRTPTPQ